VKRDPQSAVSPRTPLTCYEGKMRPTDVEEIVTAYGAALAEPTALGIVRDVRSLPRSKEDIKTALKTALEVTADVAMRESLKAGYNAALRPRHVQATSAARMGFLVT